MPTFTYLASTKEGKITEGEMEVKDQAMVLGYLQKHDLFPLSVKEKKKERRIALNISFFDRITTLDKITLTRNIATMIHAGIGISEAVDIMREDAQKPLLKKFFTQAKLNLEKGHQLSETFAAFPAYFSDVTINLVRAGEASGNLENALMHISTQLKKEYALKKKVQSALAYPAVLLAAASGVVILLVTLVLPRVSKIFMQSKIKLPLFTRMLLGASDFITSHWFLLLILVLALGIMLYFLWKSRTGILVLYRLAGHIPLLSSLMRKIALTRFNSILYSLLKSGMPIIKALEITANSVGNAVYKSVILAMTEQEIAKGISFGMALKRRPEHFPRLTTSMIIIGEKSGNLEAMLETLANFYEEEVDGILKGLVTILEPLLLLAIGIIVGALALSIIMPIYQMLGTVK